MDTNTVCGIMTSACIRERKSSERFRMFLHTGLTLASLPQDHELCFSPGNLITSRFSLAWVTVREFDEVLPANLKTDGFLPNEAIQRTVTTEFSSLGFAEPHLEEGERLSIHPEVFRSTVIDSGH